MRVLTWNLWWSFGPWKERQQAIRAVLEQQQADVLFLQETIPAEAQTEELADLFGFHFVESSIAPSIGQARRVSGMSNAIISRWPILASNQILLPSGEGRPQVRTALMCHLDTPWGSWPVGTTHLDHSFDGSSIRLQQVDALADMVRDELSTADGRLPAIIGGDFNAVPDSDEIRRLTGRTQVKNAQLVFADMWELRGEGHGRTWDGSNPYLRDANWPNRRIDYLFVTWPRPKPAGHPSRVWLAGTEPVDGVMASDHYAVVADVRVPEV